MSWQQILGGITKELINKYPQLHDGKPLRANIGKYLKENNRDEKKTLQQISQLIESNNFMNSQYKSKKNNKKLSDSKKLSEFDSEKLSDSDDFSESDDFISNEKIKINKTYPATYFVGSDSYGCTAYVYNKKK